MATNIETIYVVNGLDSSPHNFRSMEQAEVYANGVDAYKKVREELELVRAEMTERILGIRIKYDFGLLLGKDVITNEVWKSDMKNLLNRIHGEVI